MTDPAIMIILFMMMALHLLFIAASIGFIATLIVLFSIPSTDVKNKHHDNNRN